MSDTSPSLKDSSNFVNLAYLGERHSAAPGLRHVIDRFNVIDTREYRFAI